MKIYSISVVKNEDDIIEYNLEKASEWSDKIFVLDNGSTDNTWDIVQRVAQTNPKIIPWKQANVPFYEGLRAEVFHEFKNIAKKEDWWCARLDSDEFYIDNPKEFLTQIPSKFHFVNKDSIDFYLTKEDVEEFELTGNFAHDRQLIQYYMPKTWIEPRFFRHRPNIQWNTAHDFPKHMGILYPNRIKVAHYQHRSLSQITKRISTRKETIKQGFDGFYHAIYDEAKQALLNRNELRQKKEGEDYEILGYRNQTRVEQRKITVLLRGILMKLGIIP